MWLYAFMYLYILSQPIEDNHPEIFSDTHGLSYYYCVFLSALCCTVGWSQERSGGSEDSEEFLRDRTGGRATAQRPER